MARYFKESDLTPALLAMWNNYKSKAADAQSALAKFAEALNRDLPETATEAAMKAAARNKLIACGVVAGVAVVACAGLAWWNKRKADQVHTIPTKEEAANATEAETTESK